MRRTLIISLAPEPYVFVLSLIELSAGWDWLTYLPVTYGARRGIRAICDGCSLGTARHRVLKASQPAFAPWLIQRRNIYCLIWNNCEFYWRVLQPCDCSLKTDSSGMTALCLSRAWSDKHLPYWVSGSRVNALFAPDSPGRTCDVKLPWNFTDSLANISQWPHEVNDLVTGLSLPLSTCVDHFVWRMWRWGRRAVSISPAVQYLQYRRTTSVCVHVLLKRQHLCGSCVRHVAWSCWDFPWKELRWSKIFAFLPVLLFLLPVQPGGQTVKPKQKWKQADREAFSGSLAHNRSGMWVWNRGEQSRC